MYNIILYSGKFLLVKFLPFRVTLYRGKFSVASWDENLTLEKCQTAAVSLLSLVYLPILALVSFV